MGKNDEYIPRQKLVQKVENKDKDKDIFSDTIGYDSIKKILTQALGSEFNINILLDGPPGTGKTLFLRSIEKKYGRHCRFLDCTLLTKAGLRDFLFDNQHIKILLLDEISRLTKVDQGILLNLATNGEVIDGRAKKNMQKITFKNLKIFCTSNNKEKLLTPVHDRLDTWYCAEYSQEQFEQIGDYRLFKMGVKQQELRDSIIQAVYSELGSKSIRDLEDCAKYVRNQEDLEEYIAAKIQHTERDE